MLQLDDIKRIFRNRYVRISAYVVLAILILISLNNYVFLQIKPELCSKCHVMQPSVKSYEESRHKKIACFSCHFRNSNFILDKYRGLSLYRCFYSYLLGNYEKPLNTKGDLSESFENQTCFQCHSSIKSKTPTLWLIIDHQKHTDKKIKCTRCHNRTAHPIEETIREIIKLRISDRFDLTDRTAMESCMQCHTGTPGQPPSNCEACHPQEFKLPYSCNACHAENLNKIKPRDHFEPDFSGKGHKKFASSATGYCLQCHEKQFCDECHRTSNVIVRLPEKSRIEFHKPASHFDRNFLPPLHGKQAKERGKDYCWQCHQQDFCDRCHKGIEMPHTQEFLQGHGKFARGNGFTLKCQHCHRSKEQFCESGCHHKGWNPKLGPLVRTHPQVVEQNGVPYCLQCHTAIYCAICHVSGQQKYKFRNR